MLTKSAHSGLRIMRRRTVRPNTRSFTGRHVVRDASKDVRFESGLERDFLTLTRFRSDVLDVLEQPITLEYLDSQGRKRRYTPDFKVAYRDRTVLYEVKYRQQLRAKWPLYREAFAFARSWARASGMQFRIVTERLIRTVRFENARLIGPYVGIEPEPRMAAAITASLTAGPRTVLSLMRELCPEAIERGPFYAALWPMLANQHLSFDLGTPIGMDLEVALHHG